MKKIILALLLTSFLMIGCKSPEDMKSLHTNFVHVVYFWLKNPDNASDRLEFETSLKKFIQSSKHAKTRFIGKPAMSNRDVVDDSFTYSLIVSFNSKEEQDKYQAEEVHLKFVEEAQHLWMRVVVYDSFNVE